MKEEFTINITTIKECAEKINEIISKYGQAPEIHEIFETAMPKVLKCVQNMDLEIEALREAVKAAIDASKIINLQPNIHEENDLWYARDQIDLALKKLDEARRG